MIASRFLVLAASLAVGAASMCHGADTKPTPVILDTDIGDDIDDTWALALLLRSPELDLRLVVGSNRNAERRGRMLGKLLEAADRTDVPIGLGVRGAEWPTRQEAWLGDYQLADYPGVVHQDGVGALIDTIMASDEAVTVIAIGPLQNIEEALRREPRIAERACFVGMHGSIRKGYNGSGEPAAEFNVREHPASCRAALSADWDVTITPLDTCGVVRLDGELFQRVCRSKDPLIVALREGYAAWWEASSWDGKEPNGHRRASSVLFDTVAVYLAIEDSLCVMESLPVAVQEDGMTLVDAAAKTLRVAIEWKDLGAFERWLVDRLTGPSD